MGKIRSSSSDMASISVAIPLKLFRWNQSELDASSLELLWTSFNRLRIDSMSLLGSRSWSVKSASYSLKTM